MEKLLKIMEEDATLTPKEIAAMLDKEEGDIKKLISELEAEDAIECPCHNGEYGVEMNEDYIRIYCKNCGGQHIIPCNSLTAAHDFISCDKLVLRDPEEHFKS